MYYIDMRLHSDDVLLIAEDGWCFDTEEAAEEAWDWLLTQTADDLYALGTQDD